MGHNNVQNLLKGLSPPSLDKSTESVPKALWKCLLSEFIGTVLLIFLGCGSGVRLGATAEAQPIVGIALCWAFVIASLAQTLDEYSCDINPAVTLACLATGRTTIIKAILYIMVQCIGCTFGAYLLKLILPAQPEDNYGMTMLIPEITPVQGFLLEAIATFFLVFTVSAVGDKGRNDIKGSKPLSVGLCVAGIILAVGPLTGVSLNPARSLGPSLIAKNFKNHWVFWLGPICGGLIAGVLYHHVFRHREPIRERRDSDGELEIPTHMASNCDQHPTRASFWERMRTTRS